MKASGFEKVRMVQRFRSRGSAEVPNRSLQSAAPGHVDKESALGDLTGGLETSMPFLPNFTPLERIALTATGNLQRLMSSYYNAPVSVTCVRNAEISKGTYDREVDLSVLLARQGDSSGEMEPILFCRAASTVSVHTETAKENIDSGTVGVGQLFRFYDVLPEFRLIDAGRDVLGGTFWRVYQLRSALVSCHIRETFLTETFVLRVAPYMQSTPSMARDGP